MALPTSAIMDKKSNIQHTEMTPLTSTAGAKYKVQMSALKEDPGIFFAKGSGERVRARMCVGVPMGSC